MEFSLETLQNGTIVLCVGFFVVFLFLCILIFAMGVMSKTVAYLNKVFPVEVPQPAGAAKASSSVDEEIAVAIAAVLMR